MWHSWISTCLSLVFVVIFVNGQTCPQVDSQCTSCLYDGSAMLRPTLTNPNQYFVIGGLFDVHKKGANAYTCGSEISTEGLVNSLAFFWAIDKYRPLINNKVSTAAVAFDTCSRPEQSIETVLGYAQCEINFLDMQHENVVAYVGPYSNEDAIRTGNLASDLGITLLSPTANSLALGYDHQKTLLRLRPSFSYDIDAIVKILQHLKSEFVIILRSDNDPFWAAAYKLLMEHLHALPDGDKLCVQFEANMDGITSLKNFVQNDLKPRIKSKFVVPLLPRSKVSDLLDAVSENADVTGELRFILTSDIGKDLQLLTSKNRAAIDSIVIDTVQPAGYEQVLEEFQKYINAGAVAALTGVVNPWLDEFKKSGAALPKMDANTPAPLVNSALKTIMAVRLVISGLDTAMQGCDQQNAGNYQFCDKLRNQRSSQNNLYNAILPNSPNEMFNKGELVASHVQYEYSVFVNRNGNIRFEKVGEFDGTTAKDLKDFSTDSYFGKNFNAGECPKEGNCCEPPTTPPPPPTAPAVTVTVTPAPEKAKFSLVKYRHGQEITGAYPYQGEQDSPGSDATRFDNGHRWIIALGTLAGLGIFSVIVFEIYILYKLLGTRMGHKWRTMWLGQLLLFGIFLAYLVLFAYIFVPTKATCGITRFGVGVSYAICFAVLLVKLMVILTSKSSDNIIMPGDESPNYLKGIYQFLMFVFAVGVQVVIDVQWLITVPPEAVQVTPNGGGKPVWVCNHYTWNADQGMTNMDDFVRSNFENHVMSLTYIMVLIVITTLLSLNAHGIITNHRESVFIGIAGGFSIPIWLAWGLVGGLNKDHEYAQEFGDACIAFGLFLTVTLILFSMFLPKVRQLVNMGVEGIYLEDDRDTYYAGSVIMAPPSTYKSKGPNSVIYVNNQGIYSEPMVVGNGDPSSTHLKHPMSTYSAPPAFLKKQESAYGSTRVLRVTDDLKGRHPGSQKRPISDVNYGGSARPRSQKGTLPRSRSHSNLGAL